MTPTPSVPTLDVENLEVGFVRRGASIAAVRRVSLRVDAGECVGVVGESGSGKTQLFLAVMGLSAPNAAVRGSVRFEGEEILGLRAGRLNRLRGSKLTMIFQDPMTSLTPHLTVGTQLAEVSVRHLGLSWADSRLGARRMLDRVGVPEPAWRANQYPHELSGGLRQRVMIGMSLMGDPSLVIADEPTSALDVTTQLQIIDLLRLMREETGMGLVLISHDFAVVAGMADRILVMYAGAVVESAPSARLLRRPRHPYTAGLLGCVPSLVGPRLDRMPTLAGQPPRPDALPDGCAFAPRCPRAAERCLSDPPALAHGDAASQVACHFPLPT